MSNKKLILGCFGLTLLSVGCTLFFVFWTPEPVCKCISSETHIGSKKPSKVCECGQGLDLHALCQNICPWNITELEETCIHLDNESTILQCGSLTSLFHMYPDHTTKDADTGIGMLFLSIFGIFGWICFCCYLGCKQFDHFRHAELEELE